MTEKQRTKMFRGTELLIEEIDVLQLLEKLFKINISFNKNLNKIKDFSESNSIGFSVKEKRINILSICDVSLEFIPQEITILKNLEILNLCTNCLKEFPEQIYELKNLKILNISQNMFEDIPIGISKLTNLKELYVFGMYLSNLPDDLSKLHKLQIIDCSYNEFTKIPVIFENMPDIESIDFLENPIQKIPIEYENYKWLSKVKIDAFKLIESPPFFDNKVCPYEGKYKLYLREIKLLEQIKKLTGEIISDTDERSNIFIRILGFNVVVFKCSFIRKINDLLLLLKNFTSLKILSLYECGDINLSLLGRMESINTFEIAHYRKKMENLFLQLKNFPNLTNFILRESKVIEIPSFEVENHKLKELNFASNKIETFPESIIKLKYLKLLDIRDNPIAKRIIKNKLSQPIQNVINSLKLQDCKIILN